jgi:hypothetical protein
VYIEVQQHKIQKCSELKEQTFRLLAVSKVPLDTASQNQLAIYKNIPIRPLPDPTSLLSYPSDDDGDINFGVCPLFLSTP